MAKNLACDGRATYAPTGGESGAEVSREAEEVWGGYLVVVLFLLTLGHCFYGMNFDLSFRCKYQGNGVPEFYGFA